MTCTQIEGAETDGFLYAKPAVLHRKMQNLLNYKEKHIGSNIKCHPANGHISLCLGLIVRHLLRIRLQNFLYPLETI